MLYDNWYEESLADLLVFSSKIYVPYLGPLRYGDYSTILKYLQSGLQWQILDYMYSS